MLSLNLCIIKDYINSDSLVFEHISKQYSFYLERVRAFSSSIEPHCVYIVSENQADLLPTTDSSDYAVIITGATKAPILPDNIEYIALSDPDFPVLYNSVCDAFLYFQDVESRILRCFADHSSFNEIGKVLFEIFRNPVSFCTPTLRVVMYVYNRAYKQQKYKYYELPDNTYLPDDEYQVVITDPEYQTTLKTTLPSIFSANMYGYRKLYLNVFYESEYLGRLVIDEIFEPQKQSGFAIMQLLSSYIKRAYLELCPGSIGASKEMENAIYDLAILNEKYSDNYASAFKKYGWVDGLDYIYIRIFPENPDKSHSSFNEDILYLNKIFESSYVFIHDNSIHAIIHQRKSEAEHVFRTLETLGAKNGYRFGCSNWFIHLNTIRIASKQAQTAYETGIGVSPEKILFQFDDYILTHITELVEASNEPLFFLSPQLIALMAYDMKNNTELVRTLEVSLNCNQRAYIAQEELHVHRTTYLYRMRRIEEITGWDLENSKLRLYLQFAMEIIKRNPDILAF